MRGHEAAVGSAGRDTAVLIVNMPLPGVWFHAVFVCGSCFCFFFLFFFFSPVSSRPLHERGLAWLGWPAIGCIVCTRRCSNKSSRSHHLPWCTRHCQIQIQTPRHEFRHNLTVKIRPAYLLRPNSKIDKKKKYLTRTARHSSFDWYVIHYSTRPESVI